MAFYKYDRLTQFAESDAAGIIHFSNIARYVEEAEHAFMGSLGFPVDIHNPRALRWPRVNFKASYTRSILPFQKIRIVLNPAYVGKSSINWKWTITEPQTGEGFSDGEMKVVCCRLKAARLDVCPLPESLRAHLVH